MTETSTKFELRITEDDIKVNMKLVKDSSLSGKALVTVKIGPIKISGFRIMEGEYLTERQDYLWIALPSYRSRNGKFHKTFWVEDKDLWNIIEEKIFQKYNEQLIRQDIKNEDIPIVEEKNA